MNEFLGAVAFAAVAIIGITTALAMFERISR